MGGDLNARTQPNTFYMGLVGEKPLLSLRKFQHLHQWGGIR